MGQLNGALQLRESGAAFHAGPRTGEELGMAAGPNSDGGGEPSAAGGAQEPAAFECPVCFETIEEDIHVRHTPFHLFHFLITTCSLGSTCTYLHTQSIAPVQIFTTCGHTFCPKCSKNLVETMGHCALCRVRVKKNQASESAGKRASPSRFIARKPFVLNDAYIHRYMLKNRNARDVLHSPPPYPHTTYIHMPCAAQHATHSTIYRHMYAVCRRYAFL
jgi:hypothetical protein